jgi:hypothetical protein
MATITGSDRWSDWSMLKSEKGKGPHLLYIRWIVCPNSECHQFTLQTSLHSGEYRGVDIHQVKQLQSWVLVPSSTARPLPSYIPHPIQEDYREACSISALSPKASATLSRRCLQGILRDFWKVKPGRLVDEIAQIETRTDAETWQAIEAVRKVGNIGAHMEADINHIVDVEPEEAGLLIQLLEMLFDDWYVERENKQQRLAAITRIAQNKDAAKKPRGVSPS